MPQTPPDETKGGQPRRDAYDKWNTAILALTLIAAGCAAFFTYQQASIARDQEHRALRAYVVVDAELKATSDGKASYVTLTAENMGQTPVYNLFFVVWTYALDRYENLPDAFNWDFDCKAEHAHQWERTRSHTFSKTQSYGTGVSKRLQTELPLDGLFKDLGTVVTVGAVCYRDIFRTVHRIPLCYEWLSAERRPERCQHGELGEEY